MVLGHDRSSPGSPFSDLHSLHYQVTSHTKSSKSPTNSHAPWARLFQLRISILRSALTLHASQSGARMLVLFEVTQVTVLMCELDVDLSLYSVQVFGMSCASLVIY